MQETCDRHGRRVEVGTRVRMLALPDFLKASVPSDEWVRLQTMIGETFAVYEIDEDGAAWVEKVWDAADGSLYSHSVGLHASEMEVVS